MAKCKNFQSKTVLSYHTVIDILAIPYQRLLSLIHSSRLNDLSHCNKVSVIRMFLIHIFTTKFRLKYPVASRNHRQHWI